ncbi:hypothetical protein [Acetobacterium bakii]|uniref:Uncharacterized protein n=1 Tax=Acetobacterium bakii TaxID=52689 RepID=A0A0L6U1Q6_9FIRM|nr:hypothetical protein [Acetobacterium bakii]KNZ42439.1 hypothetical protein AKG39_06665 [Acetobacterium bakii]
MRKLIIKKERNLLLYSHVIKDYPLLEKRLLKHTTIDEQILKKENATEEELNIYRMRNDIVTQAKNEWQIDPNRSVDLFTDDKKVRCEVCGMPIKNVFYIKNSINQNSLRTGSECIKHFAITDNQHLNSLLKNAKQLKRREGIENIFPGIDLLIYQWKNFIEEQPIVIIKALSNQYYELGESLNSIYKPYLKHENKSDKDSEDAIRGILDQREKIVTEISHHVEAHKDDVLYPPNRVLRQMDPQGVAKLKEDGCITSKTLFRIRDDEVAKKVFEKYDTFFKINKINILKISPKNGIDFRINRQANIILTAPFGVFCKRYGEAILKENGIETIISERDLVGVGRVIEDRSFESLIYFMQDLYLKESPYAIEELYYEYKEVYFLVKNGLNREYLKVELAGLEEIARETVYFKGTENKKKIHMFLDECREKPGNVMSRSNYLFIKEQREANSRRSGF